MGYETALHLVDVKIKEESLPSVKKAIKGKRKSNQFDPVAQFLECVIVDDSGFLCFKPIANFDSPYDPNDDDGTLPALSGKWRQSEKIAEWLKQYSKEGGCLIHHSNEGDGAAWGWEFDGRSKMRELALCSIGDWE